MCGSPRQPKQPEDYAEYIRLCQVQAAMNMKNPYSNEALYQWAVMNAYVANKIRKNVIGLPLITSTEKWR